MHIENGWFVFRLCGMNTNNCIDGAIARNVSQHRTAKKHRVLPGGRHMISKGLVGKSREMEITMHETGVEDGNARRITVFVHKEKYC